MHLVACWLAISPQTVAVARILKEWEKSSVTSNRDRVKAIRAVKESLELRIATRGKIESSSRFDLATKLHSDSSLVVQLTQPDLMPQVVGK